MAMKDKLRENEEIVVRRIRVVRRRVRRVVRVRRRM